MSDLRDGPPVNGALWKMTTDNISYLLPVPLNPPVTMTRWPAF